MTPDVMLCLRPVSWAQFDIIPTARNMYSIVSVTVQSKGLHEHI